MQSIYSKLFLLAISFFVSGHARKAEIGILLPATGRFSEFGRDGKRGIELALKDLPQSSPELQVHFSDTASTIGSTLLAFQRYAKKNVSAVIGGFYSESALAVAPLAEKAKITFLSPNASNDELTNDRQFIFRVIYNDSEQAGFMARFARQKLGAKTAAILTDEDAPYSIGLSRHFQNFFESSGGKITGSFSYKAEDVSFVSILRKIADLAPDVLYLPGYAQQVGTILFQAQSSKVQATILGGDAWDEMDTLRYLANGRETGSYFTAPFNPLSKEEKVVRFMQTYQARYRKVPNTVAALSYDSVFLLHKALQDAGSTQSINVRKALSSIKGFEGVTGKISYDKGNTPTRPLYLFLITQEGVELVETKPL